MASDGKLRECSRCFQMLPVSDFGRKMSWLQPACKPCTRKGAKLSYERKRQFIQGLKDLVENKCATCHQVSDVLEFAHHNRGDKIKVGGKGRSFVALTIKQMKAELPKCRFLCHLCHIKETERENVSIREVEDAKASPALLKRREYNRKVRARGSELINGIKLRIGKCSDCELKVSPHNLKTFEFDHRDPDQKTLPIGQMHGYSKVKIEAEIAKCDLMCRACHIKRSRALGHYPGCNGRKRKRQGEDPADAQSDHEQSDDASSSSSSDESEDE